MQEGLKRKLPYGTSPRMRGKLTLSLDPEIAFRNIPAYAGKTCLSVNVLYDFPEHPRVCGENFLHPLDGFGKRGTSPRMRGKRFLVPSAAVGARNIPAYAGKTFRCWCRGGLWPEHPRVCGVNNNDGRYDDLIDGTSPRMRGKRGSAAGSLVCYRNIPAYAGKTMYSAC